MHLGASPMTLFTHREHGISIEPSTNSCGLVVVFQPIGLFAAIGINQPIQPIHNGYGSCPRWDAPSGKTLADAFIEDLIRRRLRLSCHRPWSHLVSQSKWLDREPLHPHVLPFTEIFSSRGSDRPELGSCQLAV